MPDTATDIAVPPGLRWLNEAEPRAVRQRLRDCLAVQRWIDLVLYARPYTGLNVLLDRSDLAAASITPGEILTAIADHPRIGALSGAPPGSADWSAEEQSGVDSSDATLARRLHAANEKYEHRFGHIYLICATGLSGEQILDDLRGRLGNDPDTELRVIRAELAEIAKLRLRKVVAER